MRFLSILFLFCSIQTTISQENNSSKIKNSYQEYFELPRETIYLHLNKTSYLAGEKIWFSAYVYNQKTGLPFLETTNLICGLYDSEGKQVDKQRFYVESGMTSGHFNVESSIKNGNFYIKASTNYLKKFKEDIGFTQKVTIVGSELISPQELSSSLEFDVQFLPEAGHIVSDVKNTIGFKITNQEGKGVNISDASIVDSENQIIRSDISSNIFGIGKFSFTQEENETYFLRFKLADGSQHSRKLPDSKKTGISLIINNLFNDKLAIELRTNDETLPAVKEKDLYLAIHRDGLLTLNTFKINTLEKSIYISKDKLLPGINIITLFNADLKPISERLIFNETNLKLGQVRTSILKQNSQDSVRIKLDLFSKNNTSANISISVLPEETIANNERHSIVSSVLLKPYVKSEIENASYYFSNMNRKKRFELDMLLLTQGWSRYEWEDIFGNPPEKKFAFNQGIQITGKVLNAEYKKKNTLALYANKIENIQLAEIENSKNFSFNSAYVVKGDSVSVGLINKKDKTEKPKLTNVVFLPRLDSDTLALASTSKNDVFPTDFVQIENKANAEMIYDDNTIALENVTVSDNKIEKKLTRNASLQTGVYESIKITAQDVKTKPTLAQLIIKLGFRVRYDPTNGKGIILAKRTAPGVIPPKVVLDDFVVVDFQRGIQNLPESILISSSNVIDEIYFEHAGLEGSSGGTIYIYRKYGSRVTDEQKESFTKMLATEGFQRPTVYYNPKYTSYNSVDFINYGVVHWENKATTDASGSTELNFPNFGLKKVKLFIEGMSQNGTLFSEVKTISLN